MKFRKKRKVTRYKKKSYGRRRNYSAKTSRLQFKKIAKVVNYMNKKQLETKITT